MPTLVGPLVFPLGGDPPVVIPVPPPSLDAIDHTLIAKERLPNQFRNAWNETFVEIFVKPFNDIELAYQELLVGRTVGTAVGAQLDNLGKLVGQPREGLIDDDYRRFIRARIFTNKSNGTHEVLIRVIRLLLDNPAAQIEVLSQHGGVAIRVNNVILSASIASILLRFARDAVEAAIRVFIESFPDTDDNLFTFGQSFVLDVAIPSGATILQANNVVTPSTELNRFPAAGQLVLSEGTPLQETVTWTSRSGTAFTVSPTVNAHPLHALVSVTGSNALGKGYGDHTETGHPALTDYTDIGTTGGRLADARGVS
jgi:hypothetical protein